MLTAYVILGVPVPTPEQLCGDGLDTLLRARYLQLRRQGSTLQDDAWLARVTQAYDQVATVRQRLAYHLLGLHTVATTQQGLAELIDSHLRSAPAPTLATLAAACEIARDS